MVSRRNFLSMLLMMAVIVFMFQVPEVIKENQSDYDTNDYAGEVSLHGVNAWTQEDGGPDAAMPGSIVFEDGDFVVFFGDTDSNLGHIVEQWCVYTKRNLLTFGSFDDYSVSGDCLPEAVLVDSDVADPIEGFSSLEEMTGYGITLIFCNLPEPAELRKSRNFLKMLGIKSIQEEKIETEGILLFGNLFLGGDAFYVAQKDDEEELKRQDMELNVPWYIMESGTKTYMVATLDELLEDEEAKNELFPSLIWRNVHREAQVFAVIGDYLEGIEGLGILDGMMYEASAYSLYPVVNAQNITVLDFPVLSGENDERIMELYSRSTEAVQRDVFWPALSALERRSHHKLTCFLASQFNYSDDVEPSGVALPFYMQQFKEFSSEAGISLDRTTVTDISEKIVQDEDFFGGLDSSYAYSAMYVREEDLEKMPEMLADSECFTGVKTLVSEYQDNEAVVSYCGSDMTRQNITADASFHSYSDNMKVRSLETALGYSNVLLDMYSVIWPETEENQWERLSEKVASNLDTYWRPFRVFDKTTLSESDGRIRTFLNLDYRQKRVDDTIYLEISGSDGGWFILRTHGEKITGMDGGTYVQIEEDAYLINAEGQEAEIRLERSRGLLKYTLD